MPFDEFRARQAIADLLRIPGAEDWADFGPGPLASKDDPKLFAAISALIVESLSSMRIDPLIGDLWATRSDRLLRAPQPIRAALMNGIRTLGDLGLGDDIEPPSPADFATCPSQPVATALIRIARQMTAAEIEHVARADRGCDTARHRTALQVLLDDPALAYPERDVWYPAEVVELVSHVPGQPGHVPCLAIVLLDALRNEDLQGNAKFRLEQQHDRIAALPPGRRDPILAGFRHLYESVPHWSPSIPAPFTLPWVSVL